MIQNLIPISNRIFAMDIDSEGNLWCGASHNELAMLERNTWHVFHGKEISSDFGSLGTLRELHISNTSGMWAVYGMNLLRYFEDNWIIYADELIELGLKNMSSIAEGPDGSIWIGSLYIINYIAKWDGENWDTFQIPFQKEYEQCTDLAFDIYGNLWVSSTNDIYNWDGSEWHSFGFNGTDYYGTTDLTPMSDGNVWIGLQNKVLVASQREIIKEFTKEDDLPVDISGTDESLGISSIKEAPDGTVWVLDKWGLGHYDGVKFKSYYYEGSSDSLYGDLAIDASGRLFISSDYGLSEFTPTSVTLKMNLFAPGLMYKAGDSFSLSLNVNNYGPEETGDLYFVMMTPEGNLYSGLDWSEGVRPAAENMTIPADFSMPMIEALKVKLPANKPPISMPGKYYFALALADSGTTYFRAKAITSIDVVE